MKKIHVHVESESVYMDEDVFVFIELPSIPRKGEFIWLSSELIDKLEMQATKNLDIASRYLQYFGGKSYNISYENLNEKNLKDLSFEDNIKIGCVWYKANTDTVHIEISKSD